MSWVTVIWSMIASACLDAGGRSTSWSGAGTAPRGPTCFFSVTAASTAAYAFCELPHDAGGDARELLAAMTWAQMSMFVLLVSTHLVRARSTSARGGAGSRGPSPACARSTCCSTFLVRGNVNYREVTSLRQIRFLGESVTVLERRPQSLDAVRPR